MGPFDRTVTTRYEAKVDGYLANVARMRTATKDLANEVKGTATKNKADWDKIGNGALAAGAIIGTAVGASVVTFARFDKAMSSVSAALDDGTRSASALAAEKAALGEAAIQAGQDTVFSAMEAAQAEAELARAGVATADILGGALRGSLDLAAAGQVSLQKSAETTAQALNIFDLAGADATRVADTLTAGANKSAAGVDDLSIALSQGGGAAAQLGLSVEDTVGTLALFADNALKGSDAGTSLRTMLGRLNPTTEEARQAMADLGLDFYDAQGSFVGIEAVAGQLQDKLGGLTEEQRNLAVQTIFGQDAQRGANILINEGADGIGRYIDGVTDLGAAQRAAARQTDNLMGDVEQLKGTLESAFIRGGAGANDGLRDMVQSVTGLINGFNELDPAIQSGVVKAAALTAGILLVGGAGIKATTSVLALKASLDAAGVSAARLAAAGTLIGGAALVAGVALAANELGAYIGASSIAEVATDDLADSMLGLIGTSTRVEGALADLFRQDNGLRGDEKWVSEAEAIERFAIRAENALSDSWSSKIRRAQDFGQSSARFSETVGEMDRALADLVRNGNADEAAHVLERFLGGIEDTAVADRARESFTGYQAALDETTIAQESAAASSTGVSENLEKVEQASEDAKAAVDEYVQSLVDAGLVILSRRSAERELADAILESKDALEENGRTLDTSTEKGRANQAALDNVAKSALDLAQAVYEETGSEEAFRQSLQKSRSSLVDTGKRFGLSQKDAEKFADSILNIPPSKTVTVKTNLAAQLAAAKRFQSYINGLNGKDIRINVRYNAGTLPNGGRDLTGGITQAAGGYITGPGTATSDSIAAWLSNGEYVIKAAAVAKYGVHLFDTLNAMRFSGGGLATPYRGTVAAPSYYSTSYGGATSVSNDNRIMAERLVVEASNPRQMRRELHREASYNANVMAS
jgi:TP901 family phage tail tape measure protein